VYYHRILRDDFARLFMEGGELRWMVDYVREYEDLDFQVRRNAQGQWVSIYRGGNVITNILRTRTAGQVTLDAHQTYKDISPDLAGTRPASTVKVDPMERIRQSLEDQDKKDSSHGNNKEGFYQNHLSRRYGVCGEADSEFVIVDREAVVGHSDEMERQAVLGTIQQEYLELKRKLLAYGKDGRYGRAAETDGNEVDFIAVDRQGNILLIELKRGSADESEIFFLPFQIGVYYEIWSSPGLQQELCNSIPAMIRQKQAMGLLPNKWEVPELSGRIIPVAVVAEPVFGNPGLEKLPEVLAFCRKEKGPDFLKDLRLLSYTIDEGLAELPLEDYTPIRG